MRMSSALLSCRLFILGIPCLPTCLPYTQLHKHIVLIMDEIEDIAYASSVASYEDVGHALTVSRPKGISTDPIKDIQGVEHAGEDTPIRYTTITINEHGTVTSSSFPYPTLPYPNPPSPSRS
ncbi:hypothetical protein B0T21DRAFT_445170 [Apiosordaria backusii]|uniref:Uncharacterized protein n=1 Tax=Apiosordaria backusii TaxID=314023 RepID=A0AA40EBE1_9PEZI|nr:hypothetical protein B0T21DRAFT_445170 [Apiosordaria backusii]